MPQVSARHTLAPFFGRDMAVGDQSHVSELVCTGLKWNIYSCLSCSRHASGTNDNFGVVTRSDRAQLPNIPSLASFLPTLLSRRGDDGIESVAQTSLEELPHTANSAVPVSLVTAALVMLTAMTNA